MPKTIVTLKLRYPAAEMIAMGGVTPQHIAAHMAMHGICPLDGTVDIDGYSNRSNDPDDWGFQATWSSE